MKKSLNNNCSTTDKIASTLLGKKVGSAGVYNPEVLVAVPRKENRDRYLIDSDNLPFKGWDVWHCYEFSALCENGLPVTQVLKLKYSAASEFIVESKSLKLYLNSFNMFKCGKNKAQCLELCKSLIEKDLRAKLKTSVEVNFLENVCPQEVFSEFQNVEDLIDISDFSVDEFKEAPHLLKVFDNNCETKNHLFFSSLRSNCRVTHQPDFGEVFIYYKSRKKIDETSLVKYLVSFREEYHFHEECCEMIYKRLSDLLNADDELMVCALYTRRGGIDISPVRFSKNFSSDDVCSLVDLTKFVRHGIKQ